jgi:hypothetical protein
MMRAARYTLLLVDGCHYIGRDDAARVAAAVRGREEAVEVTAQVCAAPPATYRVRVLTRDVLKLIGHDVVRQHDMAYPASLSDFRAKRNGRRGSRIPVSTR